MHKVLVFDVNETLLDLSHLDIHFEHIFGNRVHRNNWFQLFIQNAFLSVITENYEEFGKIGVASLEMIAKKLNIKLRDEDKQIIFAQLRNLPAHTEVVTALEYLISNDYRLFTLTNSTEKVVREQLENAKIASFFESVFTADSVKSLKPSLAPYNYVAKELQIETRDLTLIAAHSWDIAGAQKAGYRTGYISRERNTLNPLYPESDYLGRDLLELAKIIVENNQEYI